ncbi:MAG: diadenylate cyclase [Planctomycetota bacterium]
MLSPLISWTLQIAILSTGIYLFLRFLRTTKGSGLLRGLMFALSIGAIGLWGLSKYLEFEELNHIIEGLTPYMAVILVIIFQPELRRAMARLGRHNRFAQLFTTGRKDMVSRMAKAAAAMAARRHGALVAFQQDMPLDTWTANAAHIDAEMSTTLIESIFHPGAALHDGAVVIEGDRVVAAACLFPLTENIELSKSTGTRHRAALGLTEETDAVTLIVSEETGEISIARQGFMSRDIKPDDLEHALRDALGLNTGEEDTAAKNRGSFGNFMAAVKAFFTDDILRKAGSLAMASAMIYLAHQDIVISRSMPMQVVQVPTGVQVQPRAGLLHVRLPKGSFHLVSPLNGANIEVLVRGTQANLDRLGTAGGFLEIPPDVAEGSNVIPLEDISWVQGSSMLEFGWPANKPPQLEVQHYSTHRIELKPSHVPIDKSKLDAHLVIPEANSITFAHDSLEIQGPRSVIEGVRAGSLPFELETIVVQSTNRGNRRELLGLAQSMISENISIVGDERISVELAINPAVYPLPELEVDLVVRNLLAESNVDPNEWIVSQADARARFTIETAGLFASEPGSGAFEQTSKLIRDYITNNLRAYVDVSEFSTAEDILPVRWSFPDDWREALFPGHDDEFADSARLEVKLQSEAKILLTTKK